MPPHFTDAPKPARTPRPAPPAPTRRDEARLLAAARGGDRTALTKLLELVAGPAQRFTQGFCRDPHDAEDLAQDVLATLLRSLDTFRGDSSLTTWVYTVARRSCIRMRRRAARQSPLPNDDATLIARPDPGAEPHRGLERRQLGEALERAIASLPMAQREVLVMRDVEGLPAAEVGKVLGLGERAVKSRLHRARLVLREKLAPHFGHADAPAAGPSCPDTARALSRYVEGELSPGVCAKMEAHVKGCPACGEACQSLKQVLGACRDYGDRKLSSEMRAAVKRAVRGLLIEARS